MTAYEKLKAARASDRPKGSDFVRGLFRDRVELCGDRRYGEDPSIVAGIGYLGDRAVTYIAIDKGADMADRMKKHFGCPMPEGYRKALRLMKQAEKFHRPVICLIDTLGAYCGAEGEERGQGLAIAENLTEMMGLRTPILSVVIGEGGKRRCPGAGCGGPRIHAGKRGVFGYYAGRLCQHYLEGCRPGAGCGGMPAYHGGGHGDLWRGGGDYPGGFRCI